MKYKITLARMNWQYCEVEVEAPSRTEALERLKSDPEVYENVNYDWSFPEPDDDITYPEDPETSEAVVAEGELPRPEGSAGGLVDNILLGNITDPKEEILRMLEENIEINRVNGMLHHQMIYEEARDYLKSRGFFG